MLTAADQRWMAAALVPYLALAGYDGWLHEKARQVPRVEKILHALLAVAGVVMVCALFKDRPDVATIALAVFAAATVWDEAGFHGPLAARERRLHFAAYACLSGFLGVAAWRGALAWP